MLQLDNLTTHWQQHTTTSALYARQCLAMLRAPQPSQPSPRRGHFGESRNICNQCFEQVFNATKTLDSFEQVCIGCTIALCEKFSLMWTVLDTAAQRPGWRVWKDTAPEHLHFQVQKNPEKSKTIETQMSFSLCPYSFSGRSRLQFSKDLESVQSTWKRELCVRVSVPSF